MIEEEKVTEKFLWLFHYIQESSAMSICPFYGVDEAHVRKQVKQFIRSAQLAHRPIHEHSLQAAPHGFTIHRSALRGVVHERPDGTLIEGSIYE
jgi:hypothetical protein